MVLYRTGRNACNILVILFRRNIMLISHCSVVYSTIHSVCYFLYSDRCLPTILFTIIIAWRPCNTCSISNRKISKFLVYFSYFCQIFRNHLKIHFEINDANLSNNLNIYCTRVSAGASCASLCALGKLKALPRVVPVSNHFRVSPCSRCVACTSISISSIVHYSTLMGAKGRKASLVPACIGTADHVENGTYTLLPRDARPGARRIPWRLR